VEGSSSHDGAGGDDSAMVTTGPAGLACAGARSAALRRLRATTAPIGNEPALHPNS